MSRPPDDYRAPRGPEQYWVPDEAIDGPDEAIDVPDALADAAAPGQQPAPAYGVVPRVGTPYVADPRFGIPGGDPGLGAPVGDPRFGIPGGDPRLGAPVGDPRFGFGFPGAPGSPLMHVAPDPAERRRRSPRWRLAAILALVALVPGARWVGQLFDNSWDLGTDYSHVVVTSAPDDLPRPATVMSANPAPGFEESGAPLGVAPIVTSSSTSYEFIETRVDPSGDIPLTWSPCRPIHFVVDTTHAPDGFIEQVMAGVGAVSVASGLVFVFDGVVTEAPDPDRESFQPSRYGDRWAPVLIQFADETAIPAFADSAVGLATVVRVRDRLGVERYVTGTVHLHTALLSQSGRSGVPAYVPVLRHELGHLVGLGHVEDRSQLMFSMTNGVATYQPGDLAGLAILGQGRCAASL